MAGRKMNGREEMNGRENIQHQTLEGVNKSYLCKNFLYVKKEKAGTDDEENCRAG